MATYSVLSSNTAIINGLTPVNAVKATNPNPFADKRLCGYPDAFFSSFDTEKINTQKLFSPGIGNTWVLMPYEINIVSIYAFDSTRILTDGWLVPNLGGGTIDPPGTVYANFSQVALAAGIYGGLVMLENGDLINS